MAYRTSIPVPVLRFDAGSASYAAPALHPQHAVVGVGTAAAGLVARAVEELHGRDEASAVAALLPPVAFEEEPQAITLKLPVSGASAPELSLTTPVVVGRSANGLHVAVSPAFQASWPGTTPEDALRGLAARVRAEAYAEPAPPDALTLATACAVRELRAESVDAAITLPTRSERAAAERSGGLLEKAAEPLAAVAHEGLGMEDTLGELRRAIAESNGVILVGPSGAGRSSLLCRLRHDDPEAFRGRTLWTTTPASLMVALVTDAGGWQDALARLVRELNDRKAVLHVSSLSDLFEVGRYEGNSTSTAEALLPFVRRGDLRLISEASAEEVGLLEARYPGALDGLARVRLVLPPGRLQPIVDAWCATHAAGLSVRFQPGTASQLLGLQHRFRPYAGQPGRAIATLRALAASRAEPGMTVGLDARDVVRHVSTETGIPLSLLDPNQALPEPEVRAWLGERIYGQPDAVDAVARTLAAIKADVAPRGRPLASLLLVGPTGVGKTETAKAIAAFLFGDASRLLRFDMSEYATPWSVLRLVGGPEGEGVLTSAVRRQPFSVVLLDEVEKAHPSFLDLLLQVLGEGRLTDDKGRLADFCGTVVLLTSNVGSTEARRGAAGFGSTAGKGDAPWLAAVSGWLRPELRNRIDRVLVYRPLDRAGILHVLDRELAAFADRSGLRDHTLDVRPAARAWLADRGYDPAWGARHLLRALHDHLALPVARALDSYVPPQRGPAQLAVTVDAGAAGLTVQVDRRGSALPPPEPQRLWDEARDLARRARSLRDSLGYAEAEGRVAGRKGRRWLSSEQAAELAVAEHVTTLIRELGVVLGRLDLAAARAWYRREVDPTLAERLKAEGARLDYATRGLYDLVRKRPLPVVWGVYGPGGSLRSGVMAQYTELLTRAGARFTAHSVWQRGEEGVGRCPPDQRPLPACMAVGDELDVEASSAALLLSQDAGIWEEPGRPAQRVRCQLLDAPAKPGPAHDASAPSRPPELLRKSFVDGKPLLTWTGGTLQFNTWSTWTLDQRQQHRWEWWHQTLARELA